ncbi:MAG TPA: hypothetical protein VIK63_00710 [Haloplasmataceae bacterium]
MKKTKRFNKKGITLMELLGYIALIGLALMFISNLFIQLLRNYDEINGRGALQDQANRILTVIMTSANTFDADFVRDCANETTPCIAFVKQQEFKMKDGILIQDKIETIRILRISAEGDIYLGDMKLNDEGFKLDLTKSSIEYECHNQSVSGVCANPIITIDLWLYRIHPNDPERKPLTESVQYRNTIIFH